MVDNGDHDNRKAGRSTSTSSDPPSSSQRREAAAPPEATPAILIEDTPPPPSAFTHQTTKGFLISIAVALASRYAHWTLALVVLLSSFYILSCILTRCDKDFHWLHKEERRRTSTNSGTESVEWMNEVLQTIWPLITQDYFVPFADLLENTLMQQVPGIVHSCRVEDLDQGYIPLRIQSLALLPSNDENAFLGAEEGEQVEKEEIVIDSGDFVNLEIAFAYRSPSASKRKKAKTNKTEGTGAGEGEGVGNREEEGETATQGKREAGRMDRTVDSIHILIYMAIGLQKIAAVEVPVWCEILGFEGKIRLRLQLIPVAPFVKHIAFTFVGIPELEISAKPLGRRMVLDAMHLPLISGYVVHSLEAVIKEFVMPKSYTIDIAGLLDVGDGPQNGELAGYCCYRFGEKIEQQAP